MWLTNVAIRRPLFILMVIGALLVVGLVSWTKLGVDLLPALDFPIVVVTTPYPGASPDAVDILVTKPVEDAVASNRDLGQLQRLAEDKIQKRLEATDGVAQVSIYGGLQREIQVQVDQQKLQARGLSILQVNQALAGDNLNVPAGSLTQQGKDWTVRLDNQAQTPAELNNVLVANTSS